MGTAWAHPFTALSCTFEHQFCDPTLSCLSLPAVWNNQFLLPGAFLHWLGHLPQPRASSAHVDHGHRARQLPPSLVFSSNSLPAFSTGQLAECIPHAPPPTPMLFKWAVGHGCVPSAWRSLLSDPLLVFLSGSFTLSLDLASCPFCPLEVVVFPQDAILAYSGGSCSSP